MSDVVGGQAPGWVRIVAVLGLLWNAIGCYFYLGRVGLVGDGAAAGMDAAAMSTWMTAAFATSVFGGLVGCVGLLMLKGWSRLLLVLSLLAILAQDYALFNAGATEGDMLLMPAVVTVIGLVLAWVSHTGVKRGWLT